MYIISEKTTAAYVGSFDPITLGHLDIITRASKMYSKVYVGLGINDMKKYLFSEEERQRFVEDAVSNLHNVEIRLYQCLTTHFCNDCGASILIRGLRAVSDFEAEFVMCMTNYRIDPEIETVLMMPRPEFQFISSSLVRELARVDTEEFKPFVTGMVAEALRVKFLKIYHPELET